MSKRDRNTEGSSEQQSSSASKVPKTQSSSSSSSTSNGQVFTQPNRTTQILTDASARARFWKASPIGGMSSVRPISEASPVVNMNRPRTQSHQYVYSHLTRDLMNAEALPAEFEQQLDRGLALPQQDRPRTMQTRRNNTSRRSSSRRTDDRNVDRAISTVIRSWLGADSSQQPVAVMPLINLPAPTGYCEHPKEFPVEVPDEYKGEPFGLPGYTCVICTEEMVQTFTNCGHLVMCISCARELVRLKNHRVDGRTRNVDGKEYCEHCYRACPQCRQPLTAIKRLYL